MRHTITIPITNLLTSAFLGLVVLLALSGCGVVDFFYQNTYDRVRLETPGVAGARCVVVFPDQREATVITPGVFLGKRGRYRVDVTCQKACYLEKNLNTWMPQATSSAGNYYSSSWNALLTQYLPTIELFLEPDKMCHVAPPFSGQSYDKIEKMPQSSTKPS